MEVREREMLLNSAYSGFGIEVAMSRHGRIESGPQTILRPVNSEVYLRGRPRW